MFRVYLSGSMAGRVAEQVKAEREMAVRMFYDSDIFAVDPGASEQKLRRKGKKSKITLSFPPKIMKAFVAQDKWLIRRCDALLVMTGDSPSDGTWREMCYAEQIGIPVVMIGPRRRRRELMGWSNIEVEHLVDDLESAVRLIKRKWVKDYESRKKYFDAAIRNAESALGVKRKKSNSRVISHKGFINAKKRRKKHKRKTR